jgi:PAS domain S-box-containing protein
LHGGKVWAESVFGVGTTFRITLPKGIKHLPAEQVHHDDKSNVSSKRGTIFVEEALRWLAVNRVPHNVERNRDFESGLSRRILLADDNADMRQYIEKVLAPEFEVETVADGSQALRAIANSTPDLVLTDVMMPELDGFGLLQSLRSNKRTQAIPVIMLSARAGEEASVEGLHAGADDYLVKPFHARELLARVRVNLELARLRKEVSREEEQRRSAAEIERQWRLFDTALSHTPDSIYIFDLQDWLLYANQALLQRWNKPFSEVVGRTLVDLGYPAEIAAKLRTQMQEVVQGRPMPVHDEATLTDASGTAQYYDYVLVPVFSHSGETEAVAGSSRNVTGFKETNRALSQANADLRQFAYSASHDLQEPLRMVAVYSQLLKKMYHGRLDAQADLIIQQCVDEAVRMEGMIRDLLAYAEASVIPVALKAAILSNEIFDTVTATLQLSIRENGASVTRGDLPFLKVEQVHLSQLFQNLFLSNALKYRSERPPVIRVSAHWQSPEWIFSVADNGIGIEPEYRDQIFGLFKRLHTRERYSGTGLGLAICRKLVEHYHGRIWVESELGKGSTFFFSLPAEQSAIGAEGRRGSRCVLTALTLTDHGSQPPAQSFGESQGEGLPLVRPGGLKECVLIIEDNPGDVFIIEEALREHNVQCGRPTVLSDGDQAALFFDAIDNDITTTCPTIVLLDLNLPRRSGHWILRRIRASLRCPLVPVVIVSSSEAPADMEQNRQLGATAYFKKPSNLEEFLCLGALVKSLLLNS